MSVEPGVKYPREVPIPEGVPSGWIAIEQKYGDNTKSAGKTYTRYSSSDKGAGAHMKCLGSVTKVFDMDGKDKGYDGLAAHAVWKAEREEKIKKEREAQGQFRGEEAKQMREEAINTFKEKFGSLNGSTVSQFPGWTTKWQYHPSSTQTHVTYIEPDSGRKWMLLKELEACMGYKMQKGEDISPLILAGEALKDQELFAASAASAKDNDYPHVYEICFNPVGITERINLTKQGETAGAMRAAKRARVVCIARAAEHYVAEEVSVVLIDGTIGQEKLVENLRKHGAPEVYAGKLASLARKVQPALVENKFDASTIRLLAVFPRKTGLKAGDAVAGVYYKKPEVLTNFPDIDAADEEGREFYQKLLDKTIPGNLPYKAHGIVASVVHIFWSKTWSRWKIGSLDDTKAGFAICSSDKQRPEGKPWEFALVNEEMCVMPAAMVMKSA